MALAQFDAETRFHARAARGNTRRGLGLLDKLDRIFEPRGADPKGRNLKV